MTAIVAKYALVAAGLLLFAGSAPAADITVMISGGYAEAYKALVPQFEQATGNKVTTVFGPSMGETPQAIPNRIARGEPVDVVIGVGYAVDKLADDGKLVRAPGLGKAYRVRRVISKLKFSRIRISWCPCQSNLPVRSEIFSPDVQNYTDWHCDLGRFAQAFSHWN